MSMFTDSDTSCVTEPVWQYMSENISVRNCYLSSSRRLSWFLRQLVDCSYTVIYVLLCRDSASFLSIDSIPPYLPVKTVFNFSINCYGCGYHCISLTPGSSTHPTIHTHGNLSTFCILVHLLADGCSPSEIYDYNWRFRWAKLASKDCDVCS